LHTKLIACCVFLSAMSLSWAVWRWVTRNALEETLRSPVSAAGWRERGVLREVSARVVRLLNRLGLRPDLADMENKLILAGRPMGLGAEEFIGLSAVVGAALLAVFIGLAAGGLFPFPLGLLLSFAVAMMPWQLVKSEAKKGRERMRREVIDLASYLEAAVSAGVSPVRVLEWYSEGSGLLAAEIKDGLQQVRTGRPVHALLFDAAAKHDVPEADELAVILRQESEAGVSISKHLADLSRDFRMRREMEMNAEAARVKPKVTAALVLFALIATGLLVAGPVVQRTMEQGLLETATMMFQ